MKESKQIQSQVERPNGVGEGAGGDGIDASGSDVVDGVEGDAAAGFEPESAGIESDGLPKLREVHVIEQDEVDVLEGEEVGELLEGGGFQLDAHDWVVFADVIDGVLEGGQVTGGGGEVIVFDHDGIVEAHTMVDTATGFDGLFFEQSPTGGGFASVPDFDGEGFDGIDVASGHGGDAGEALEEVEGGAFGGKEGAGAAFDFDEGIASGEVGAVWVVDPDAEAGVDFFEDGFCDGHAGNDAGFPGDDASFAVCVFVEKVGGGDISWADVFCQSSADEGEGSWVHGRTVEILTREMRSASAEVAE